MKRLVALAGLILLLGAGLLLALRPAQPAPVAPVVVMPLPYRIPPQKLSLFERWVPRRASWAWYWRLRETILGRPKVCNLTATVVDVTSSGESLLTNRTLPAPAFRDTNGLKVWLLTEAETGALSRSLQQTRGTELLYMPRIGPADGMQASLFAGSTFPVMGVPAAVGLAVDFFPRLRPNSTDVTTIISLTEAITNQAVMAAGSSPASATGIQTNFAVLARIQVPKAGGVFLLDGPPAGANQKRIGVLLSVSTATPRK